jgi:hypothetical protein
MIMRETCWNWSNVELKWYAEFDMFNVEIHFDTETCWIDMNINMNIGGNLTPYTSVPSGQSL